MPPQASPTWQKLINAYKRKEAKYSMDSVMDNSMLSHGRKCEIIDQPVAIVRSAKFAGCDWVKNDADHSKCLATLTNGFWSTNHAS
mmetsp:Transcript_7569/g.17350  ORF Transcript_7569/g.17350 Transcript_7569/m.17350 type:complete len:86 (-) Transcript_7569:74-331(-)